MALYVCSDEYREPLNTAKQSLFNRILSGRRKPEILRFDLSSLLDQYQYPDAGLVIDGVDPALTPVGVAVQEDGTAFLYFRHKDPSNKGALYTWQPRLLHAVDIRRVRTDEHATTVRFDDDWKLGCGVVHYPTREGRRLGQEAFLAFTREDQVGFYRHTTPLKQLL